MPPVIILNALFCTDSRISSSVSVQLHNTILAYSRPGRMKEVYIVVRVFLSNKYFSFARTFNFLSAFTLIVVTWSFHERFVLNSTPRCLCFTTDSNVILLNRYCLQAEGVYHMMVKNWSHVLLACPIQGRKSCDVRNEWQENMKDE